MATNSSWPLQEEQAGRKRESTVGVSGLDDGMSESGKSETLVVGTTNLYVDGQLRLIPVSVACCSLVWTCADLCQDAHARPEGSVQPKHDNERDGD